MTASPIAGLRILDFTHVFAGPFCTRTLADLGGDVVHVESPSRDPGDRHRSAYAHRSKRSICLDLKSAAGYGIARRLAASADVVVENFSAGVMERLRLDYATLAANHPHLVYLSLSGYGHSGPRRSWTSMNMNLQAYTGLMLATGAEGDPPTAISNSWNDYIGGLHGVIAVLQALTERAASGRGGHLDLSQFECSVATVGPLLMSAAVSGHAPVRRGNRSGDAAPQGVYPCAGDDEWIAIAVETDAHWRALAGVLGPSSLARDERFATTAARLQRHGELDELIAAWTRRLPKTAAEARLQAAGVPAERMRRAGDVMRSPDSGGAFRPVPGERAKPLLAPTLPFTFSRSSIEPLGAPCKLGEHRDDVLHDWLALDDEAIDALERAAAFGGIPHERRAKAGMG